MPQVAQASPALTGSRPQPLRLALALVLLTWAALFLLRMSGPDDLMDNDQERPASYIMDAVENGNWIVQRDSAGEICSKPPLYTWMGALTTLALGRPSLWSLYLPTALATLATALLILFAGRAMLGARAGIAGALMFLVSPATLKQIALARTDTIFAALVFAAVLAAWRAWQLGRGWMLFWLLAAAITLTKGPLGILLALGGFAMLLLPSERRTIADAQDELPDAPWSGRGQWLGLLLFLVLTLGWFALAYDAVGQALVKKMLGDELFGHAVSGDSGERPFHGFYKPPGYFFARFAPWALFTFVGIWMAFWRPPACGHQRRAARYLATQAVFVIALFSASPHQRADHLLPMVPTGAMLAGWALDRLLSGAGRRGCFLRLTRARSGATWVALWAGALLIIMVGLTGYYHRVRADEKTVVKSREVAEAAAVLHDAFKGRPPLLYVNVPYALQFHLGMMQPRVSASRAARALQGRVPAFVASVDPHELRRELEDDADRMHEVLAWPPKNPWLVVLSNHPRLEHTPRTMTTDGPLWIELDGLRLLDAANGRLRLEHLVSSATLSSATLSTATTATIQLRNESDRPSRYALDTPGMPRAPWNQLAARETKTFALHGKSWLVLPEPVKP